MPAMTPEQIDGYVAKLTTLFATFEKEDLGECVALACEMVDKVEGMTGQEKYDSVQAVVHKYLEVTDTPWLPDSVVDGWIEDIVMGFVGPFIKGTKGAYDVNTPVEPKADGVPAAPAPVPEND